jgi:hypothetical protein
MQMTRRYWLAALCTLAVLWGASSAQAQTNKLLPNDTEMIVTINLQQILKSEVLKANKTLVDVAKQKIEEKLDDNGTAKFLKQAGFDLFTDLASITISMPGNRDVGEGFVVLEGKFDAAKIAAAATEASKDAGEGLKAIEIANIKAFQVTKKEDGKTIYVGVLNTKTMIASTSKADFAEAAGRLTGSKQAAFKTEFKNLLTPIKNTQSISMVATSDVLVKLFEKAPEGAGDQLKQVAVFLKQMEGISAALTMQKDIDFQLSVNTKEEKTAMEYQNLVNLGLGVAKTKVAEKAKDDEKFAAALTVLNSIRATATGANLMIRGQITFETLEKVLQNLPIGN